jgi:hypothetical protein
MINSHDSQQISNDLEAGKSDTNSMSSLSSSDEENLSSDDDDDHDEILRMLREAQKPTASKFPVGLDDIACETSCDDDDNIVELNSNSTTSKKFLFVIGMLLICTIILLFVR